MAPPGGAGRGWCSGCRVGAQAVAVTSAMAALAEAWSTRFLPAPAVAIRAAMAMLLTVRGLPRAAWWIWAIASVGEQLGGPPGLLEVVADVAGGLVGGHALHLVADGDPLLQGCQHAQLDGVPERRLADQDGRERGTAVHVMIRHHSYPL